jgi:DNA-binding transcriptional MerR regulator
MEEKITTRLPIGKLSEETGVKVTTIRYYESIGLVKEPPRSPSGRRLYGEEAVQTVSFIRHGRELGFSVDAIKSLLVLQSRPDQDCSVVKNIATEQLVQVQRRIAQLEALKAELKRMIQECEGGTVGACEIMEALNNHGSCVTGEHERIMPL